MRHAGAGIGVDLTQFMPLGPDFGRLSEQGVMDNAKNESLTFGLTADMSNAGTIAGGYMDRANILGEAATSNAQTAADANVLTSAIGAAGKMAGGAMAGIGDGSGGGGSGINYGNLSNDEITRSFSNPMNLDLSNKRYFV